MVNRLNPVQKATYLKNQKWEKNKNASYMHHIHLGSTSGIHALLFTMSRVVPSTLCLEIKKEIKHSKELSINAYCELIYSIKYLHVHDFFMQTKIADI